MPAMADVPPPCRLQMNLGAMPNAFGVRPPGANWKVSTVPCW